MPKIVFVDEKDNVIGSGTKEEALQKGIVHRISRILLFNSKGELLIQKRSGAVHSPGRWDQSAAGHVDKGESYLQAAQREIKEEIGLKDLSLKEIKKFYTEEVDEKEAKKRFNTLYVTNYDGEINFNQEEISEIKWITPEKLSAWMEEKPEDFTRGFIKTFNLYTEQH